MCDHLYIIGAGLTGLSSGIAALNAGINVTMFEASDRVGGQVFSSTPTSSSQHTIINYGSLFYHKIRHQQLAEIVLKNRLNSYANEPQNEYFNFNTKLLYKVSQFESQIQFDPEYRNAIVKLNRDASHLDFTKGYNQLDQQFLDISLAQYLKDTLEVTEGSLLHEYLLVQVFLLTGGDPATQSALGLLYIIAGFKCSTEEAFSLNRNMHCIEGGMGRLVAAMETEFLSLGGVIARNKPVIAVRSVPHTTHSDHPNTPNYDYADGSIPSTSVQITFAGGEVVCGKAVIVAVPLRCLPSIQFSPPLPVVISQAAERCHDGQHMLKVHCMATGVSKRVDRVLSASLPAKEVSVYRSSEGPFRVSVGAFMESEEVDDEGAEEEKPVLLSLVGWRRDLRVADSELEKIVQRSHPVAHLVPHNSAVIRSNSQQGHTGGSTLGICHDFVSDPWSRGAWFVLRAGTGQLHVAASQQAVRPWASDHNASLTIACSDLSSVWTGWMEGAVLAGQEAARRMIPYVKPVKVERNFFRRVNASPDKSSPTKTRK